MEILIILGILYVLPVLLGVITCYVLWYKRDKNGHTVEDMNEWLSKNTSGTISATFVPILNWVFVIIIIADALGPKINKLKIK